MKYELVFFNHYSNEDEIVHIEANTKAQAYLIGQAALKKRIGTPRDPYLVPHRADDPKIYTIKDLEEVFAEEEMNKMLKFALEEAEILDEEDLLPDEY